MTITPYAPALPLLSLSADETAMMSALRTRLMEGRFELELLDCYFNGEQRIRDLGISIPPQLRGLHTVIGWPRIGVESLEERLDLEAFRWADGSDSSDLTEIADANDLLDESSLAHTDSLLYGREYVAVGSPDEDRDLPVITMESPLDMSVLWDPRRRVILGAWRERQPLQPWLLPYQSDRLATLYLPNSTISLAEGPGGWQVYDRDDHNLGVVLVARMANRQRTGDRLGRSEITRDVMSITDAACRRLMGIEVAAEFFGAPARYILGASESAFQDAEGNAKSAWETYIGRVLALERDEDGNLPEIGQFSAHDPSGQTKIIDLYARIMATQLGVPPHMLGYTTDNPASADAIRSTEGKLVKKAERRQRRFGATWANDVMRLALWVRDGQEPDRTKRIQCVWRNAATPTVAASTDAAVKLVTANILPADSDITLQMIGLTSAQIAQVRMDQQRSVARQAQADILSRLGQLAAVGAPDAAENQ